MRRLNHGVVHDSVPALAGTHAEKREDGVPKISKVCVLVEVLLRSVDLAKDAHPEHSVDEKDKHEQPSDVHEDRKGDKERLEQHGKRLELAEHFEDSRDTQHAQHRCADAHARILIHEGEHHHQKVDAVPRGGKVPPRPEDVELQHCLYEENPHKHPVGYILEGAHVFGLVEVPHRHDGSVAHDEEDDEKVESVGGDEAVEVAASAGWILWYDADGSLDESQAFVDPYSLLGGEKYVAPVLPPILDKVVHDDPDEKVEDKKEADKHKDDEEDCAGGRVVELRGELAPARIDSGVHNVEPALRRGELKKRHVGVQDVVKVGPRAFPQTPVRYAARLVDYLRGFLRAVLEAAHKEAHSQNAKHEIDENGDEEHVSDARQRREEGIHDGAKFWQTIDHAERSKHAQHPQASSPRQVHLERLCRRAEHRKEHHRAVENVPRVAQIRPLLPEKAERANLHHHLRPKNDCEHHVKITKHVGPRAVLEQVWALERHEERADADERQDGCLKRGLRCEPVRPPTHRMPLRKDSEGLVVELLERFHTLKV
mmetsp:Transcript_19071/g.62187  ORF Transcript_19071/g.62187 Transcript_19071/m.62187 type:complete len:541 (-) Transcript_19071:1398-3020(-)